MPSSDATEGVGSDQFEATCSTDETIENESGEGKPIKIQRQLPPVAQLASVVVRQSQRARVPTKKTVPGHLSERERGSSPSSGGQPPRKRGVRCMECPACLRIDDCSTCVFCKDKPKFGGPGVKKQACM